MSEVKVGNRVSIDSLKVGQPRRTGTVKDVTEGISGLRYLVEWDDGHQSYFSPSSGNLIVEGNSRSTAKKKTSDKSTAKSKKGTAKSKKGTAKSKKSTAKSKKSTAKSKKSTAKSKGKGTRGRR